MKGLILLLSTFNFLLYTHLMRITVHIKLTKHTDGVEQIAEGEYVIKTTKLSIENKANEDIIRQLADYFHVSKSLITLIHGASSKHKTFFIEK